MKEKDRLKWKGLRINRKKILSTFTHGQNTKVEEGVKERPKKNIGKGLDISVKKATSPTLLKLYVKC